MSHRSQTSKKRRVREELVDMTQDFENEDVSFGLINDLEEESIEECRGIARSDMSPRNLNVLNETPLVTTGTYYIIEYEWFRAETVSYLPMSYTYNLISLLLVLFFLLLPNTYERLNQFNSRQNNLVDT